MGDSDNLPISTDITVPHNDTSIVFSQMPWWFQYTADLQGKTYMVTKTYLAQFTFNFVGSKIWYYSDVNNDHGPFSASIDGVMYGTWSSAWPTERPNVVLFHASIQPGNHTLTVTNLSDAFTSLEHLVYRPLASDPAVRNTSIESGTAENGSSQSLITPGTTPLLTEPGDPRLSPASGSQRSNTIAYIAIALGVVCFLLLVSAITLVYVFHRRRSPRSSKGVLLHSNVGSEHDINASQALHPFPVPQPTIASISAEPSHLHRKLDILTLDVQKETSSRTAAVALE